MTKLFLGIALGYLLSDVIDDWLGKPAKEAKIPPPSPEPSSEPSPPPSAPPAPDPLPPQP
ncbi:MAG: hypothetical protein ACJ8BW_00620 [Ktedonobacteraceae bacterium]